MASAKRPAPITDSKGRKLQAVRKGVDAIDPSKRYWKLADKRAHSERFTITADKLKTIVERKKNVG